MGNIHSSHCLPSSSHTHPPTLINCPPIYFQDSGSLVLLCGSFSLIRDILVAIRLGLSIGALWDHQRITTKVNDLSSPSFAWACHSVWRGWAPQSIFHSFLATNVPCSFIAGAGTYSYHSTLCIPFSIKNSTQQTSRSWAEQWAVPSAG